ncbi:MAG: hypothetical protein COX82_01295 [Candidatus Magasanikbacteria bacterium CG_4_10_14_0_2_um_filter_41_10]|uniref:Uncharacterized protein n=1 Tax=Candidatus Magasanikbacteria bacterium CG_4_10_14_0_2_um_filter_41_10 TaxID=1974638 RepID=A0A2M7V684_9BACT|nr:MAG: hypothetical protein COX82_01295 [Candidatus Magasanikbacteria bacterium CG_4_10_14_0_2_um_filter_41_10]
MKKSTRIPIPFTLAVLTTLFYGLYVITVHDAVRGNAWYFFAIFALLNIIHIYYFLYIFYLRIKKRVGTIVTLLSLPPFPVYLVTLMAIDFVVSLLPL